MMKVSQCAMMEEIVTVEENEEVEEDEIVFGKLRSLELVSLRNLTSFCNSQSKLVFRFPSLQEVKVSDCLRLKKFSENIISTPKLEKVDIVEGEEGDKWHWEGDLNATIQNIFLDKVLFEFCQNLELSDYPELQQLWREEISPPNNCFNNLRTLIIMNCSFLSEVFPCKLLPYFKNLEELHVSSSPVEVIFDIDGNSLIETKGKPFHLKRMNLHGLQNLKCIWSKDPCSIMSFLNLKEIIVSNCAGIKTLFPASLARNLVRLERLEIIQCHALEEIVGKEEAVAEGASRKFEFHYLTTLTMYHLPSLKFFYPGRYTLEFSSLVGLDVCDCNKLEIFASDFRSCQGAIRCEDEANISASRKSLFMDGKVIQNLEFLTLSGNDMMMLSHGYFPDNLLHKLKTLRLHFGDSYEAGATLPFKFFQKLPNLERLMVSNCNALDEVFPSQRPKDIDHIINILAQVRELELDSLPLLSSIGLDYSWVDSIVKNLRALRMMNCPRLTILVPSSAVSFCNLKELEIEQCHGLVSLFSSSVAKRLVQLREIEITECGSITHIVSHEIDESDSDEIIFERLEYIILRYLPSLVSFYSGNATLEFSALVVPAIEECPKMKCFSQGIVRAPNLKGIEYSKDNDFGWHNYSDLNATMQKLFNEKLEQFTCGVQELKLGDHPELGEMWQGAMSVSNGGFSKLKTLIVDGCQCLSNYVIPFHVLGLLSNLEDVKAQNCDSVKAIFEVGSLSSPFSIPLKTLTLQQLPILENIWSEDPYEFLIFQSLQHVYVQGCGSLKSLFPASMLKRKLESLEVLVVRSCAGLIEIVAKDETALRGATSYSVIFPNLITLVLWSLPQLKCIYPGLDYLEWPKLKVFYVYHCDQLRIFPTDVEAIVSIEKGFPNLEQLSLNKADIVNINWQGKCEANFIQKVKFLMLHCFHEDTDGFPYELFQKGSLPNLQKLRVVCSEFKEIFNSQRPDVDLDNDIFAHLKGLELIFLGYLESIGLEQPWVGPILENLETLLVDHCHGLRNLVPSAVSFSKLRALRVRGCQGLVHLFTLSTARSLVLLEELSIESCASIQEIVSKEGDASHEDDITFSNLKRLFLLSLPRLGCFLYGNSTLNFPCLELVYVHQCPKMRFFSNGTLNSTEHLRVSTRDVEYRDFPSQQFTGSDLNASINLLFPLQLKQFTCGIQDLKLGDHPELGDIWHGAMSVPNGGFSKLKALIVDGCPFLSHYVIPFYLLRFLNNLEDLQVQNCDSIRAVFEVGSWSTSFYFPMKSMTLEELPNLEQVWNEDPRETLSFQSLQHVYVQGCKSLKNLFPTSMAQGKLESLEILKVECCEGLVEIAAREETALEESARNLAIFPSLTELRLWKLSELRCICSGLSNVEWPKLKELDVYQCGQLKNIGLEDKVFPNFEHLSLCKEDIMEIWRAPFTENLLQRAKILKLHGFCDDSDVFPDGFFKKESLPHVEKFAVSHNSFKQIFTPERSDLDGCADEFFSQLKTLELISLSKLNSIGLEHTPLPGNLEILKVSSCPCLVNLAPSTVSFSNLRGLDVSDCDGLVYLFTSSTAKSLALLEDLTVGNCGSMREIVTKEEDESDQDEITFENLKNLKLKSLPSLDSFYTGAYHLKFPCLEQVSIYDCSQMKVFSDADIYAPDNVTIASNGDVRDITEKAFKKAT